MLKCVCIPEYGLGPHLVGSPELHAEDLWLLIRGGGESSAHNLVLVELQEARFLNLSLSLSLSFSLFLSLLISSTP